MYAPVPPAGHWIWGATAPWDAESLRGAAPQGAMKPVGLLSPQTNCKCSFFQGVARSSRLTCKHEAHWVTRYMFKTENRSCVCQHYLSVFVCCVCCFLPNIHPRSHKSGSQPSSLYTRSEQISLVKTQPRLRQTSLI